MNRLSLLAAVTLAIATAACQRSDDHLAERLDSIDERLRAIEVKLESGVGPGAKRPRARPPERKRPDPAKTYSIPVDGDPFKGAADAPVTIIKAYEFACPYCEQARPLVDQLLAEYGEDVKVVYKTYVVHPQTARVPALAACAAARQGEFAEMEELIWEQGFKARKLDAEHMKTLAAKIGLDAGRFAADMSGVECKKQVSEGQRELARVGVRGTPTFWVNGRHVRSRDLASMKRLIDEELERARKRIADGTPQGEYYDRWVVARGVKKL